MTLQLITAQLQLSMCLIVQLRGDIQTLGFGERVTWATFALSITVINQCNREAHTRQQYEQLPQTAARRAVEAARVGFKRIFVSSYTHFDQKPEGIEVVKVADIPALVRALFK